MKAGLFEGVVGSQRINLEIVHHSKPDQESGTLLWCCKGIANFR